MQGVSSAFSVLTTLRYALWMINLNCFTNIGVVIMKTFKFLESTIFVITVPVAIGLATIALLATCFSVAILLGSLTVAVHLLADKNATGENTAIESAAANESLDKNDVIAEVASLSKFSIILFRIFILIIRETASRLPSFARNWAEAGAEILSFCQDGWLGLTESAEMYKKTLSAAIVHSWVNK